LRAVKAAGYEKPTEIQAQAIPLVMGGRDVLGSAQTGAGKTAAFALPILHRLATGPESYRGRTRKIRVLALAPTRELAVQIGESFAEYGRHTPFRNAVVFGGVSQHPQTRLLRQGVDILIATPGRLFDLMQQGFIDLRAVEIFVLDEADRMLDMGFLPDIRRVVAELPAKRQSLFFSATMPQDIRQLADSILRDPARVQANAATVAPAAVEQGVYLATRATKLDLLKGVLRDRDTGRTLVFTRTKHGADRLVQQLQKSGIRCEAIHGDKTQASRQRALGSFRSNARGVLVATDVASRGLDIDAISHVVNYDMPADAETYVHRIGRTGRAGAAGTAISLCSADERSQLRDVERLLRRRLTVLAAPAGEAGQEETPVEAVANAEPAANRKDDSHQKRRPTRRGAVGGGGKPRFGSRFGGKGRRRKPGRVLA
jgi:ATP-dependent RNA helicase RhlE